MLERYQRARELLDYDPASGHFTWKEDRGHRVKAGDRAGSVRDNKYRILMIETKPLYEHRVAWYFQTGEVPTLEIDHINRVKDDNRWINLDHVSMKENCNNTVCQLRDNYGITKAGNKYYVKIRRVAVGSSTDLLKARRIRDNYVFSGLST